MERVFCTVLSRYRLYQGIALFCSLHEVMDNFRLYVLCMDDETFHLLARMNWKNIHLISIHAIKNEKLAHLKEQRRFNEFCWTLKPFLIETVFVHNTDSDRVTYLDADLFFFSDPSIIFENQPDCSVLLSRGEIRIPSLAASNKNKLQKLLGNFNSGFISFLRDESGSDSIEWWKRRCLESCLSYPETGRFGDQKYLDELPHLFPNVCEITTPCVNIGHWNSANYNFSVCKGEVFANMDKLICYHFSGFRVLSGDKIVLIHETNMIERPFFYAIYLNILRNVIRNINQIDPSFNGFSSSDDLPRKDKED